MAKEYFWSKYKIFIDAKTDHTGFYKGFLNILFDSKWVVNGWYISFVEAAIDIYSTKSWFLKQTPNFKRRLCLFKKLFGDSVVQKCREYYENELVHLTKEQIDLLNEYFFEEYDSTIKNSIAIFKGYNPQGELHENKVLFIELSPNNIYPFYPDIYRQLKLDSSEVRLKSTNKELLNNQAIKLDYFVGYREQGKESSFDNKRFREKQKEVLPLFQEFIDRIEYEYSQYSINTDNIHIFKDVNIEYYIYEKCHIWSKKDIKNLGFELLNQELKTKDIKDINLKSNKYQKIFKYVSNKYNYLDLTPDLHKYFDDYLFTYDQEGKIKYLENDRVLKYLSDNQKLKERFLHIPKESLTKEMLFFIEQRNKTIKSNTNTNKWIKK